MTETLIKIPVYKQSDTTNSTVKQNVVCCGWGYTTKTSGSSGDVSKTVTFPVTFSAAPIVTVAYLGSTTSSPTTIGSFANAESRVADTCRSITTTQFVYHTNIEYSPGVTEYFGFSWIAVGVV